MKKISILSILFAGLFLLNGCQKDYLDTKPSSSVATATLFESFENARMLIVGTNRARFRATDLGGNTIHQFQYGERSSTGLWDYLGDDYFAMGLQAYGMLRMHRDNLHVENERADVTIFPWTFLYRMIENVNQLICGIDDVKNVNAAQKAFLLGNALVYRAHYHHLIVQTYAQAIHHSPNELGVPIMITIEGEPLPRSTVAEVYAQIEKDLKDALTALETQGVAALTPNITFASPRVVKGLLARFYMCKHDWDNAIKFANEARVGVPLMTQAQYANGFFTRNDEWMWASFVPNDEANSYATFPAEVTNGDMYPAAWSFDNCINKHLVLSADPDDCRFKGLVRLPRNTHGGDFDVPTRYDKYRTTLAAAYDLVYMRGAEMLLTEAEAMCMKGGQSAAVKALLKTLLTARVHAAYAGKVDAMTDAQLLEEVKWQRRIEFWGEGFRFHDLKRRGESMDRSDNGNNQARNKVKIVTNPKSHYWVYKIPNQEVLNNPHMVQNDYDQDWR